jgi:hypothetical protein
MLSSITQVEYKEIPMLQKNKQNAIGHINTRMQTALNKEQQV